MKNYQQSALYIEVLQHETNLLAESLIDVRGNAGLNYGGASSGPTDARTKENSWSDVWNNE
jgi:hypothetical protein